MVIDEPETVPAEVLDTLGLGGASIERFEKGLINRHWLATMGSERRVLRRYTAMRTAASVAWEQALVEFAAQRGWPVPRPLPAVNGAAIVERGGRLWSAAPYLPGEFRREETPALFHIHGRLLARLHSDLAAFPVEGQRPDFGKTWELDGYIAPAGVGSFNQLLAAFGREYPELAALIRRERYRNLRELSRLHYPDLPDLPIHGDFQRWNLLWAGGELTGLLDFDFARRDALVCDLAPLLMPFQPLDPGLARALFEGYQSVRLLSDEEWELLPALVRSSLLWWVAFLLVEWRQGGGEPEAITRTMTVRFPACNAAEATFRALRNVPVR